MFTRALPVLGMSVARHADDNLMYVAQYYPQTIQHLQETQTSFERINVSGSTLLLQLGGQ
jgi:hypothetical protein